ncbi:MAG: peptide chain release factor 2 [Proteobacteria bacterium]|nr:peptide chain release factor 2 [Pseudomonadota bacterium]
MEIEKINEIEKLSLDLQSRLNEIRGYLDYEGKKSKLNVINQELENPDIWNDQPKVQELNKQKKQLENIVIQIDALNISITNAAELFELGKLENDDDTILSVSTDLNTLDTELADLEFKRMFCHPMDPNNCFIDIQAGSGGTEAQDWAEMLLRMYMRYCDKKGFTVEILEEQNGDVAGIKNASIKVSGDYAFGYLRTETGVHRLVRNSPFDANNKRHTSFSSVFVYPEVNDDIEIEINPADLRIDTYRASGAGGQHINKTDSAIRITHIPTNTVVQCQSDRSQHRNRDEAMKMLKAKLYELELRKKESERQKLEESKSDIGWGHQIRSYVFDQSRIKDLRTGVEIGNIKSVMDGDLDEFITASLKTLSLHQTT